MKLTKNMKKGLLVAGATMAGTTLITSIIRYRVNKNRKEIVINNVCNEGDTFEEVDETIEDANEVESEEELKEK